MTGVLSNWLGRRPTIILLCIPLLSGWLTVGLSGGSITWICIGRVLQGMGIMSSVTQVYLVEIADAKRRFIYLKIEKKFETEFISSSSAIRI